MEAISAPVLASEQFRDMQEVLLSKTQTISVLGVNDLGCCLLSDVLGRSFKNRLVVTYSEDQAKKIYENYRFFDKQVYLYPAKDALFYSADVHSNSILRRRVEILKLLCERQSITVVLPVDALLDKLPPLKEFKENRFVIDVGADMPLAGLRRRLVTLGYEKKDWVEQGGQFAVRGGIVDIFPLTEECPFRVEFFGDEVDSIRSFDVESQRSIENLSSLAVYPATELVLTGERIDKGLKKMSKEHKAFSASLKAAFKTESYARINREFAGVKERLAEFHEISNMDSFVTYFFEETVSFLDYFMEDGVLFLDDISRIWERTRACCQEFETSMESRLEGGYILPGQAEVLFRADEFLQRLGNFKKQGMPIAAFSMLPYAELPIPVDREFTLEMKPVPSYQGRIPDLLKDMQKWKQEGLRVLVICPSATRGRRLADNLEREGVVAFFSEDKKRVLAPREVMVTLGHLQEGFILREAGLVVISENDIMPQNQGKKRKHRKHAYEGEQVKRFSDLTVGDYVVHEQYGVGIYKGIETITVDEVEKDYISIEYKGGSKLYILCSNLESIQKYASSSDKPPKINRLGGTEWARTKTKAKEDIETVARELVELYAIRQEKKGFAFSEDTVWQTEFEELFPYEETEDQLHAINDTKRDMESPRIMDRLICGDVGFGKTEIAIRAAFKAVLDSKQVAYLVPTTILAQQHYNVFRERMKDFPVKLRMLSRFCTAKEQRDTIRQLEKGEVDIVIGTHRLLSKDVQYKNLGLLIIDEEQRFGVSQKEKIKQLKNDVDVLTLSATPIPRTLHMSLVGIRDMSLLEEPPVDRRAIQTYVLEYNAELVKEAITRELSRKGQVYYVYNRVTSIDIVTNDLKEMLPDARIAYAHGQMPERELENIMKQFIDKELDVLVSTTIIETGLDISNVNTMIIHDADKFGLSQLYQLRGRIGRSNRNAYAFLMYKRDKQITEVAEKRLEAIRQFTDLGSGFHIAMRDLEIRGAGNLLGKKQSGQMESIGYDLYCKLLNEEVQRQKGIFVSEETYETAIDLPFDAMIPATYVKNEFVKLGLYKKIANMQTKEDYDEMVDELIDRFGDMPKETANLLDIALLKADAHRAYITEVAIKDETLKLTMYPKANIQVELIPALLQKYRNQLRLDTSGVPIFSISVGKMRKMDYLPFIQAVINDILEISGERNTEAKDGV